MERPSPFDTSRLAGGPGLTVAYLVHDLSDAAVHRRVRSFLASGLRVSLFGFRRTDDIVETVERLVPVDLGQTADRKLVQRVGSVLKAVLALPRWGQSLRGADILVARQLETLAIAVIARRIFAPRAPLAFECLDIHTKMTSSGRAGRLLRGLEGWLLLRCQLLIVSSPAFVSQYFTPTHAALPRVLLLENKVLEAEVPAELIGGVRAGHAQPKSLPPGPVWRIGWFGMIRCARSLELLAGLVRQLPGQIEIVMRGRPARAVMPGFDAIVAETPGLTFLGPYDRASDLAAIYDDIHFSWAMDFYEAGANSDWLLPNRLYESGISGTIPIALASVETGRWLAQHGAGVLLDEPLAESLRAFFAGLTPERYASHAAAMRAVPMSAFVAGQGDVDEFLRIVTKQPA